MRLANREVREPQQIRDIVERCRTMRLGLQDDHGVFVVPVNFGYDWELPAEGECVPAGNESAPVGGDGASAGDAAAIKRDSASAGEIGAPAGDAATAPAGAQPTLWIHCAVEGRKAQVFAANPQVAFEMDVEGGIIEGSYSCSYSFAYESVMGVGCIRAAASREEKLHGLGRIMAHMVPAAPPVSVEACVPTACPASGTRAGSSAPGAGSAVPTVPAALATGSSAPAAPAVSVPVEPSDEVLARTAVFAIDVRELTAKRRSPKHPQPQAQPRPRPQPQAQPRPQASDASAHTAASDVSRETLKCSIAEIAPSVCVRPDDESASVAAASASVAAGPADKPIPGSAVPAPVFGADSKSSVSRETSKRVASGAAPAAPVAPAPAPAPVTSAPAAPAAASGRPMLLTPETPQVAYLCERDWRLARLVRRLGPIECYVSDSGFANLAHSIIEQMLSVKVAATMEARLRQLCGGVPTPKTLGALSVEQIRSIGVSQRKAESLHRLALSVTDDDIAALASKSDAEVVAWLTALPGIGIWTAHMFMLFSLQRPDILPVSDLTFRRAFEWLYGAPVDDARVQAVVCDLWHPYSSYAARYLYRALDDGLVASVPAAELLGF